MATRRAYTFFVDTDQLERLRYVREREGIPESEQIRAAIDDWLGRRLHVPSEEGSARREIPHEHLLLKSRGNIYLLLPKEFDWCKAAGNLLELHTSLRVLRIRMTIGELEAQLAPCQFIVKIHRSYVVNIERARQMESSQNGRYSLALRDGTRLPVSRGLRLRLLNKLRDLGSTGPT